ncbi:hypothetical protein EDD18DRAFT_1109351 [Armillaria luteobubalina]|uniref:Uncharacterized protein n=1 Tax=Armillaria luteobubalina TaxID=153913 RepID=A0AA39UTB0_9AGAR|nr:hypothetical protein EDD18DRAFT_1109351 [Armillaria luteobubalina]
MPLAFYYHRDGLQTRDPFFGNRNQINTRSASLADKYPAKILLEVERRYGNMFVQLGIEKLSMFSGWHQLKQRKTCHYTLRGYNGAGWMAVTLEMDAGGNNGVFPYRQQHWNVWLAQAGAQGRLRAKYFFDAGDHVEAGGSRDQRSFVVLDAGRCSISSSNSESMHPALSPRILMSISRRITDKGYDEFPHGGNVVNYWCKSFLILDIFLADGIEGWLVDFNMGLSSYKANIQRHNTRSILVFREGTMRDTWTGMVIADVKIERNGETGDAVTRYPILAVLRALYSKVGAGILFDSFSQITVMFESLLQVRMNVGILQVIGAWGNSWIAWITTKCIFVSIAMTLAQVEIAKRTSLVNACVQRMFPTIQVVWYLSLVRYDRHTLASTRAREIVRPTNFGIRTKTRLASYVDSMCVGWMLFLISWNIMMYSPPIRVGDRGLKGGLRLGRIWMWYRFVDCLHVSGSYQAYVSV